MSEISTKPYMLRAIYEWCSDSGFTPYIAVKVNQACQVPMAFVKNGEIVLNISFQSTKGLKLENDSISFSARFGGVARDIYVPVENVLAIYASENAQGMAFDVHLDALPVAETQSKALTEAIPESTAGDISGETGSNSPKKGGKPTLVRIK
jgi:stringent starvation protein B